MPREAFFAGTESVPLSQAPGRVSAELVTPYPPDEVVNEAIVDYFEAVSAAGGFVEGAAGQTVRTLRVVR